MNIEKYLHLESVRKGHLPKNDLAKFYLPQGLSEEKINEQRARKCCINCYYFELKLGMGPCEDGSCIHNPDVTYAVGNSLSESSPFGKNCENFRRAK